MISRKKEKIKKCSFSDPFIYVKDGVLSKEFCESVIQKFEEDSGKVPGKISNFRIDETVKKSTDLSISDNVEWKKEDSIFYEIGAKIFNKINDIHFKYDLKNAFEFQILRYHEGGNYNWHCDYGVSPHNQLTRKLSMSIQLSESSKYTGGDLEMIDYANRTIKLENNLGCGVIFDARTPHKANPVTSGVRDVLVGWVSGPPLK